LPFEEALATIDPFWLLGRGAAGPEEFEFPEHPERNIMRTADRVVAAPLLASIPKVVRITVSSLWVI